MEHITDTKEKNEKPKKGTLKSLGQRSFADRTTNKHYSDHIKQWEVNNSPFTITETENEVALTVGRYLIKGFETKEEALNYIDLDSWDLRLAVMAILIESNKEMIAEIKVNQPEILNT